MIKGLIIDMDGTILDSHEVHLEAWKQLLKKYKVEINEAAILSLFGKTTEAIAENLFPETFNPVRIGLEKDDHFLTLIPKISLFSGVSELISRLKSLNYKICIASSNPIATITTISANFKLNVDAYVGVDEIARGKPFPDMILTAASRLSLRTSECLVVGDSPYDIKAAKAANCKVIAVLTGDHSFERLNREKPDFVLNSILEIESILELLT